MKACSRIRPLLLLAISWGLAWGQEQGQVVEGVVLDQASSRPIEGAGLRLVRAGGRGTAARILAATTSDAAGRFRLTTPAGSPRGQAVVAWAEGHVRKQVFIPPGRSRNLVIELERGRVLRGRVVDRKTGKGLPGALLRFRSQQETADLEGRFQLSGLPSTLGDDAVQVSAEGRALLFLSELPPAGDPLTIPLDEEAFVVAVVTDDAGRPMKNVRVRARMPFAPAYSAEERHDFEGLTDEEGEVRIGGLPPGRPFVLEAFHEDLIAAQSRVVRSSREHPPEARLVLTRGRFFSLRVQDGFGTPLEGADVRLLPLVERRQAFQGHSLVDTSKGPHRRTLTKADGTAAFDLLPAHPVTCEIRAPGMQTVLLVLEPRRKPSDPLAVTLEVDPRAPGRQIPWRGGVREAFAEARRRRLPVFIQMTMDGERANDWMAGHHFRDPEVVRVARELPILLASAFGPGGLSAPGVEHGVKHGVSTRYGYVHPRVYQAVEAYARAEFLDGSTGFQVPREIAVTPGGRVLIHRHYYLSERELVRLMLRAARFLQDELPLRLARARLRPLLTALAAPAGEARRRALRHLALLVNSGDEHARALLLDPANLGLPAAERLRLLEAILPETFTFKAAALRGFAHDPDPRVRAATYSLLADGSEDPDVVRLLAGRLHESHPKAREALLRALRILDRAGRLIVQDPGRNGRWRILAALIDQDSAGRLPPIDPREVPDEARGTLLRRLVELPNPEPFLEVVTEWPLDGWENVAGLRAARPLLRRHLGAGHNDQLRTLLRLASRSGDALLREEAVIEMGFDSASEQIPILRASLEDENVFVRFQAAAALLRRDDTSGVVTLAGLLDHPLLANAAQEALRSLAEETIPRTPFEWRVWLEERGLLGEDEGDGGNR